MCSCCSVRLQGAAAGLLSLLRPHTVKVLCYDNSGGAGAQRGLPLALDQADLGPDITSIAAASPSPALCCAVRTTMPRLCAAVSCMQGRGNANLTEGWLTTAATVANCLVSLCYCFQCPTSQRDLTALLTSYVSGGYLHGAATQQFVLRLWCATQDHLGWRCFCLFLLLFFLIKQLNNS